MLALAIMLMLKRSILAMFATNAMVIAITTIATIMNCMGMHIIRMCLLHHQIGPKSAKSAQN